MKALTAFGATDYFPDEVTPMRTMMWQRLYDCVYKGDVENTRLLLDQAKQPLPESHEAAHTNNTESPLDLFVVDDAGKSFLMMAASFGEC